MHLETECQDRNKERYRNSRNHTLRSRSLVIGNHDLHEQLGSNRGLPTILLEQNLGSTRIFRSIYYSVVTGT